MTRRLSVLLSLPFLFALLFIIGPSAASSRPLTGNPISPTWDSACYKTISSVKSRWTLTLIRGFAAISTDRTAGLTTTASMQNPWCLCSKRADTMRKLRTVASNA
jgi:hypothetical protein